MTGLTEEEIDAKAEVSFAKLWKSESLRKLTTERTASQVHKFGFCEGGEAASIRADELLQSLLHLLDRLIDATPGLDGPTSAYRRGLKDAAAVVQEVFGVRGKERIV